MNSTKGSKKRLGATFLIAYLVTTVVNTWITLAYTWIEHTPSPQSLGVSYLHDPAYQNTVRYHPATTLAIYAAVAGLFLFKRATASTANALRIGAIWLVGTALVDLVVYVLLLGNSRWGLPPHDFYIGNQPWISLQYLGVLIGPALAVAVKARSAFRIRQRTTA
jgi:hypothetical protein